MTHTYLPEAGINTIADLSTALPSELSHIRGILSVHASTSYAKPGSRISRFLMDHRQADNTYKGKYNDLWESQISLCAALAPSRQIWTWWST